MENKNVQRENTKAEALITVLEWLGLIGCLLGLVVVWASHYALVYGESDIFGFQPANVRNWSVVNAWLLPGFAVMLGAHLSRRLIRQQHNEQR